MVSYSIYNQKWINDDYNPYIVAYYFKDWLDYHMNEHSHNQVEIMYALKGECTVRIMGVPLRLNKGDFILIDANVPHTLEVDKKIPCSMLNIEFIFKKTHSTYPVFKNIMSEMGSLSFFMDKQSPYYLLKDNGSIYHILKNLIFEMDDKKPGYKLLTHQYITEIFVRIFRLIEDSPPYASTQNNHVTKAIRFLQQHYYKNIQVSDIASAVNLHEGYLHRIFKKYTNNSPVEYLTMLRLEKAKMLLVRTDIPIIEICDYVGISSRQYFTTLFKKHVGKTPYEFRKSIKDLENQTQ